MKKLIAPLLIILINIGCKTQYPDLESGPLCRHQNK